MSIVEMIENEPYKSCYEHGYSEGMADGRTDAIEEYKELIEKRIKETGHGLYLIEAYDIAEQM